MKTALPFWSIFWSGTWIFLTVLGTKETGQFRLKQRLKIQIFPTQSFLLRKLKQIEFKLKYLENWVRIWLPRFEFSYNYISVNVNNLNCRQFIQGKSNPSIEYEIQPEVFQFFPREVSKNFSCTIAYTGGITSFHKNTVHTQAYECTAIWQYFGTSRRSLHRGMSIECTRILYSPPIFLQPPF